MAKSPPLRARELVGHRFLRASASRSFLRADSALVIFLGTPLAIRPRETAAGFFMRQDKMQLSFVR
jgi:hypothetical protein